MARNLKKDYLKKLLAVKTKNGYTVDVKNYICNPNLAHSYPNLSKIIKETPEELTISTVYYFKYYNGTGEYIHTTHTAPNEKAGTWYIAKDKTEVVLEASNRFSLTKLIQHAENL